MNACGGDQQEGHDIHQFHGSIQGIHDCPLDLRFEDRPACRVFQIPGTDGADLTITAGFAGLFVCHEKTFRLMTEIRTLYFAS